jgi:short-subunit dehydrogenase involved in D-alanine esterification of teichoic acids
MFVIHFGRRTSSQQKMPCACTHACMHARCEALRMQLEKRNIASAALVLAYLASSRHHTSVMHEYKGMM